jgi:putative SOS response-associated peptidase YedK
MCGRFVQTTPYVDLAALFDALDVTARAHVPSRNVAPSATVPALLGGDQRRLGLLRWGFVPPWARDPAAGPRPINARAEGAASSRLFAPAVAHRRCVVPIDGWFEWRDEDGVRQPFLLRRTDGAPTAIAALFSTWRASADAAPLGTVALVTVEATGVAATVHHRMPLAVTGDDLQAWLDPTAADPSGLLARLEADRDTGTDLREVVRVSRRVNDVRNDDPGLLDPL